MCSFQRMLAMEFVVLLMFPMLHSLQAECPCKSSGHSQGTAMIPQPDHGMVSFGSTFPTPAAVVSHSPFGQISLQPVPEFSVGYAQGYGGNGTGYDAYQNYGMQPGYGLHYGQSYGMSSGSFNTFPGMAPVYQGQVYQGQVFQGQQFPRANPSPPPGTIGQTYKLPSRPVPVDKHPRVGMLDIHVKDATDVIVHDMNAMRTEDTLAGFKDAKDEDIWHFESKPLYPYLDHIYRIQATFKNEDGTERKQERYVRLIMGRVVELTF